MTKYLRALAEVLELSSSLSPVFYHSEEHSRGAELEESGEEGLAVRSVHELNKQRKNILL